MSNNNLYALRNHSQEYDAMLLPFYQSDIWELNKHPNYLLLDEKSQRALSHAVIDFTLCINKSLRSETKYYFQSKIEVQKIQLLSLLGKRSEIYHYFRFMNDVLPNINSILDIDREHYRSEMIAYAERNGTQVYNTVQRVDKNMKWHTYKHIGHNLGQMYWLPENLEQFLAKDEPFSYEDDVWDIRKTPFSDKIPTYRPRYIISFKNIHQESIRNAAKKFIYHKLHARELSTCIDYLKAINLFSSFLWHSHFEIKKLSQLNRTIIEEFLDFVHANSALCARTKAYRIGKLKEFFETCILLDIRDKPSSILILISDYRSQNIPKARFYTEFELRQLNKLAYKLPLTIARMLFVIENVGMRISELSALKSTCLSFDAKGNPILTYYQYKTKKENRIPISSEVASCIQSEINDAENNFGEKMRYVFCSQTGNPVSVETFQRYLNVLSKDNNIVDRTGKPLRVKSHSFRATVATNYLNIGVDPNVIRMMIGQSNIRSLHYYAEASSERIQGAIAPILQQQDLMIRNIGKQSFVHVQETPANLFSPLCNGDCESNAKCEHFNACYSCSMFRPRSEYLPIYKYQLERAEESAAMARSSGLARVQEMNEDLIEKLQNIIRRIEENE